MLPHSGDAFEFLHGSIKHPGQTAETVHQSMGDGIDVPLGDGIKEEQFQHPVVGPPFHPPGEKFGFDPVSVPGVDRCHKLPSSLWL